MSHCTKDVIATPDLIRGKQSRAAHAQNCFYTVPFALSLSKCAYRHELSFDRLGTNGS